MRNNAGQWKRTHTAVETVLAYLTLIDTTDRKMGRTLRCLTLTGRINALPESSTEANKRAKHLVSTLETMAQESGCVCKQLGV